MVTVVRLRPLTVLRRFPLAVMSTCTTRCPGAWCSLNENRRVSVQAAGTAVGGGAVVAVDCVDVADELVLLPELPLEPLGGPGGGGGAWQSILLAFAGSLQSTVVARARAVMSTTARNRLSSPDGLDVSIFSCWSPWWSSGTRLYSSSSSPVCVFGSAGLSVLSPTPPTVIRPRRSFREPSQGCFD